MARCKYRIQGGLIHAITKQPLSDVQVEAWDKDFVIKEPVNSTQSDKAGQFSFTFDRDHLKKQFQGREPGLFFKIYLANEQIHDTHNSVQ